MRIVTRPDFDGVVCAVLIKEAEGINKPVKWVQPSEMQKGQVEVRENDIIANLPYNAKCKLWFDHHVSNRVDEPFQGSFEIAPSAAGIVFKYYKNKLLRDYKLLVQETDKIDSARLSMKEVLFPENYPFILLSMTIIPRKTADERYWNRLLKLLGRNNISRIMDDPEVSKRCSDTITRNKKYKKILLRHTILKKKIAITDFRPLEKAPTGNRFLVYSLFQDSIVSVKIRYNNDDPEKIIVSVGHSIFNGGCNVNIGLLLSKFEGGGHFAVGSCTFHKSRADLYIPKIIDVLLKNEPDNKIDQIK